jgi:hypothetical protein
MCAIKLDEAVPVQTLGAKTSKKLKASKPQNLNAECHGLDQVGGIVDTVTIPGANETEEAGDDSSDSPEQVILSPHQPLQNLSFPAIHSRGGH